MNLNFDVEAVRDDIIIQTIHVSFKIEKKLKQVSNKLYVLFPLSLKK
jgi:hypothetical protein